MKPKARKTMIEKYMDDFEVQNWKLSPDVKDKFIEREWEIWWRYFIDMVMCHLILGPAVVMFWRGTWDYSNVWLDGHLFGGELIQSNMVAISVGLVFTFLIDFGSHDFRSWASKSGNSSDIFLRYCYSVIWGLTDIMYWKGIWDGIDTLAGKGLPVAAVTLSVGLTALSLSSAVKSAWSLPNGIMVDDPSDHISSATILESSAYSSLSYRALDSLCSRLLEVCVVLTWHGVWTSTDALTEHLSLSNAQSAVFSLVIGWTGGLSLFLLQFCVLELQEKKEDHAGLKLAADSVRWIFNVVVVYVTINSFRALWYLYDEFFIPESHFGSYVIGQIVGSLTLMALRCGSCLHAGLYKDDPKQGITIPYNYISYYYLKRKDNKRSTDKLSEMGLCNGTTKVYIEDQR